MNGLWSQKSSLWRNKLPFFHDRYPRDIQNPTEILSKKYKFKTAEPQIDESKLRRLVLNGLRMKKVPDMKKVNISQIEYSNKYIEYLARQRRKRKIGAGQYSRNSELLPLKELRLLSIVSNSFKDISFNRWRQKRSYNNLSNDNEDNRFRQRGKTNIFLNFPLSQISQTHFQHNKIDEANVRLMLLYSSALRSNVRRFGKKKFFDSHGNSVKSNNNCSTTYIKVNQPKAYKTRNQNRQINLKVYQILSTTRKRLLTSRKIEYENLDYEETRTQWIEFDVTKAVRGWLNKSHEHLCIEIECDKCKNIGARILNDVSTSTSTAFTPNNEQFNLMPVLNIIGQEIHSIMLSKNSSEKYVHHHHNYDINFPREKWKNNCYKLHQRCCRHQLDVVFKKIKGFEFILQPKVFDAGYCHGRCPPRHNPAHHHALLQSLIWQENHTRAPRPCCAPSKLDILEILHVDEENSDKLKISTWTDMQVVECACS
ncbi:hypothetical protein KR074_003672 [Drosophila pseudoananassae]|nr:hypothetical protein KR074_003672 [Drosophila pseudoananassae]